MSADDPLVRDADLMLDPLWEAVKGNWDNEASHRAFVENARQVERLGYAASRYREAAADEAKAGLSKKMLAQIALVAEYSLKSSLEGRSRRQPLGPGIRLALLVAGTVASAIVFWLLWY